ncbi:hypothetical protein DL766_005890 [Monosporascus sp. MC13-8B]|uniref:Hypervirulence associated protein TUDOR domain-containing protein n=1 Tax=Monosporascus cannonballus TaxID=155416 RepID=A0ABY0GUX5_9PEZI|nr:hypothetical protein DL762_010601 [Monosporascus cannonballus]RYO88868.1 hypothetical protein DL763_005831 [Monosporascus cannonballus]RYP28392.1 hypothetical protein DL766_005890 [Monosporascus sp. MC13-8B]
MRRHMPTSRSGRALSWKWGSGAPEGIVAVRKDEGETAKASGNKDENREAQGEKRKAEDEAGDEAGEDDDAQDANTANKEGKEASK